jgi:hypothetical protein
LTKHIGVGADLDVLLNANLTPKANAVCNSGFATNPHLSGNQATTAHDHPVAQMNLVV